MEPMLCNCISNVGWCKVCGLEVCLASTPSSPEPLLVIRIHSGEGSLCAAQPEKQAAEGEQGIEGGKA